MASVRSPNLNKSILLVILMITMSQVGYLESMNAWTNGEETLDDAEPIAQSSPATSVMYGNNSTWTPQGPMLTSGYHSSSAIIAVSDEVILFKYQEGYNADYCLAAYNRYNETSWTPTFNTPSGDDCSDTDYGFEFLGMIGNTTLFTFDEDASMYKGDSIYAYNFDNDTVYRLYRATTLTYQYESGHYSPVMVGNSVYMLEKHHGTSNNPYRLGVFNFDNQTHWTYHSSLPSNCTDEMTKLSVLSESKLLTNCGSSPYEAFLFNIKNETMYKPNGLNGFSGYIHESSSALVGTQLLFKHDGNNGAGGEPWILDVSNDSAWMVEDLNPGTGSSGLSNLLRSGTSVLFNINPSQYSGYPVSNFYWYESSNNTIWQATTFTDTVATIGDVAELANGVIVFTTHKTNVHKTKFYNPANGSVWEEPAMCVGKYGSNCDSGSFSLLAVYGNTIFGSVRMNVTVLNGYGNPQTVGYYQIMAYDLSNNSVQVSWNNGNAAAPTNDCIYTNAFVFGDQVMYPWRGCSGKVNNATSTSFATMIWSPSAIRVSDAWNMSKGDLIEAGDPLSGGVGTRYNSGAGIQNLTASVEGAELLVGQAMTNIIFQYNASAINEAGLTWLESDIDANADGAESLFVADMDGDGDLDIVSASVFDDTIAWYENDGATEPSWTASDIDTNADYARSVFVADMDDDGDLDIVSASYLDDTIAWYENDGAANPSWTKNVVATSADGAMQVHVADMDDDGDLDIVSASYTDDTIAWYENDGAANPSWTASDIDTNADGAWRVYVADMDGDGDLDIVSQSNLDNTIAWYENDGAADPSWTAADIDTNINGGNGGWGGDIVAADMDGDSDLDLVSTQNGTTVWYENDGASDPSWTVATISTLSFASIHVTDMDNDGDLDIVAPYWSAIHYYENDGASDPSWTQGTNISSSSGSFSVHVADMDGDSDLDVASADFSTDTIAWYKSAPVTWTDITGATCSISPSLPTGLSIDSSTCTISGTPTAETSNTTYTVTAVMSGVTYQTTVWLSSAYQQLTPSVEGADLFLDVPMTDITFHYNASTATTTAIGNVNGQITTLGNGSTWMVADLYSGTCQSRTGSSPMIRMSYQIGDVHYFDACGGGDAELWAHNTSNGTLWAVTDINTAGDSNVGGYLDVLIGDTLYFSAYDGSGYHLWAHDASNHSTWKAIDSDSNSAVTVYPGHGLIAVDGDVFYFSGQLSNGMELLAYNTSNESVWEAADIKSGSGASNPVSLLSSYYPYSGGSPILSDDVFVFYAGTSSSDRELWAYNISNASAWQVYDINSGSSYSSFPEYIAHVNDVVYFAAECTNNQCNPSRTGRELYAYNATNQSTWLVLDIRVGTDSSHPGMYMPDGRDALIIDDTFYFDASTGANGKELWAHNTSNQTTWLVADINSAGDAKPGFYTQAFIHDGRLYFDADDGIKGRELWVYDPSNDSSWRLTDIAPGSGSSIEKSFGVFGDVFYFGADDGSSGRDLWAYDSSNGSSWLVANPNNQYDSNPERGILIGNTIYFSALEQATGYELYAYQPAEITSSGSSGSCSISPSLPAGLSIDSSTCTISGTPTVETSNTTYTVTAVISNVTYQGSVWLSTSPYASITSAVEGAHLNLGEAMTPITLNYTVNANASTGSTSSTSTFAYANDKVDARLHYTCAIQGNGDLKCWGLDDWEQLGDGVGQTDINSPPSTAIDLGSGRTAKAVSTGEQHACALLDNGDVKCWGYAAQGALGTGIQYTSHATEASPPSTAINLGSGRTAVAVTAGDWHSCAILDNGEVKCWGSPQRGVLGTGSATQSHATPSPAIDLGTGRTAVAISAGRQHTCAILDNGELKCWGSDNKGQLGDGGLQSTHTSGTYQSSPTAVNLGTGRTAIAVSSGYEHTCAILDNGSLKCWGSDIRGQLGNNQLCVQHVCPIFNPQTYPITDLGAGRTAVAVSAGYEHTCAILDNGDAKCWGDDRHGQVGNGMIGLSPGGTSGLASQFPTPPATPIDLGTGRTAVAISAGRHHTCAVLDNGEMNCWGSNFRGQLGDGNSTVWPHVEVSPVLVAGSNTWDTSTTLVTWETHPALPAGMSISAGVISGTPSVYAKNQTYTIYANQSGYSTTHELYFSVDTDNAHTVVENQTIDPIGFHPPFNNGTTAWTVSPALPSNLSIDGSTGEITGMVNTTMTNTSYTVTATHSSGATETFTFNLQSLADYDGDGLPNDLPGDYDAAEGPTSGLVADDDDDGDGLLDTVETNTGTYVDSSDTGTDPLNPDTDGDGICDGPNAVAGVCVAGPDTNSGATVVDTPIVLLNNSDVDEIAPFYPVTTATYGLSPSLPTSMQFDASNGSIWGTPDMTMANTTYTMWANLTDGTSTSWTFFLEVLEDLDGDGMPDVLPGDYNATNDPIRTPGLEEDLDDDGDGYNDTAETDTGLYLDLNNTGTDPRDPDTDDDGICDGPGSVPGVCTAGPDLTPFGPPATVVAVNNSMIPSVPPYYAGSGLTYEVMPDLPAGLTIDPTNGYLMGIPTETIGNTTFTVYANHSDGTSYSWDFTIEVLEDSDGDGSPDTLPSDYDGDNDSIRAPPGLTEDLDDDNDGASDLDEIANGTEPLNPDTDGDGFCDGINAVAGVCFAGPDPYPLNPNLPLDTDGDGLPDDDSGWTGPPYADDDDDNDGYPDVSEDACGSDSLDANSIPADMDGDTICDDADDDKDGDGIENVNETGELGVPPGSSPTNPDTDGDGICDGPESPVTSNCTAGPDAFPLDPSAWEDTDGDGYPNDLYPPSTSVPPLEEDTDDDNDGWSDIDEVNCGSDPLNATDMPVDLNGDGVCDVLDLDWDDDGIPNANETDTGVYNDSSDMGTDPWNPDTDGDGFCDGPFAVSNETEMICSAGPDPFPLDPTLPLDTDGDGLPNELPEGYIGNMIADEDDDNDGYSDVSEINCVSDPLDATSTPTNDLDGDGICDAEDSDVDGDGLSNETELAEGSLTSYMNADTDGDGVCDGPSAPALPAGICVAGPDAFPDDAAAWLDTDGDGDPDEIVDGITTDLVLDTDDDNDGWEDVDEAACGTNSKDDTSTPFDGDDDGICDVLDTQTLGYTINGNESEMFEAYVNQSDFILMPNLTGMEPGFWTIEPALPAGLSFSGTARSGETGIITGIPTEASPMTNYTVIADNGRVNISFTFGLGVLNDTDGDRLPDEPSLTGLETDLDDDNDGHLDEIELKCGSDPVDQTSVPSVDDEGNCIEGKYADDDSDGGNGFLMCLIPFCFILLLALLLLGLLFKDKVILMGPEPENTTSDPAFLSGAGTKDDPFVLRPIKALKAGSTVEAKETISIINMSPEILVNLLDLAESANDKRFRMYEVDGSTEEPGFNLEADDEGRLRLRFVFDDSDDPTYPGGTYEGLLKLGKASVYLSWTVEVKEDKRKMNKIRKEQEAAEKAEKEAKEAEEKAKAEAEAKEAEEKAKAEADAKAAEEKAAKEAEKKAKAEEKAAAAALAKKEKEEAAAKKKEEAAAKKAAAAEEKAAKEAEEAEAKAKAEADAKAAEEEAAKEAEAKAKAEEKAAAAAAAKKAKEEEEAKKKAEAEAKAAEEKAAKEAEAEAKAKAEAAAKKKAEKKPAATTKEAKKEEELQRVKKRAKSIDFKVIGEATSTELKSEVKKGAKTLEVGNASEFADSGSATITDSKGSTLISWTGKDGNVLTGVTGVTRVFGVASVVMVKDDLQVIKGIGPFLEEKLNALGITTYRQLANMNAKLEKQVNEAIEFFPGRVKRDQWVAQAKILLGEDVKLDEKALKQAEELERIAQKAEGIDFGILGVASASEADDLQKIKGIGPFIAEKLNALGIYKFSQLANMTSEIEEEVNVAIEFFPGRVKRDEWARQAKEFDSN